MRSSSPGWRWDFRSARISTLPTRSPSKRPSKAAPSSKNDFQFWFWHHLAFLKAASWNIIEGIHELRGGSMKETLEIRWHGRAGQGVVTAAVTLAGVLSSGKGALVRAPCVRERLNLGKRKIYALDAYSIARHELGRAIPNVPMVAALVKILSLMDLDKLRENIKVSLAKKLRPEVDAMNLRTIDRAFNEVKEG